jgi:hypothetical protein
VGIGVSAYESDRATLVALGLQPYWSGGEWGQSGGYVELGTVDVDRSTSVSVAVNACPAQFWRFTFGETVITTGSGTFLTYWPLVKEFIRHGLTPKVQREIERDMLGVREKAAT